MNIVKPQRRQFIAGAFASLSAFLLPRLGFSSGSIPKPGRLDEYTGEYDLILHGENPLMLQIIQKGNKLCLKLADQNDRFFIPVGMDNFMEENTSNKLIFNRLKNGEIDSVLLQFDDLEQRNGQSNCAIKMR